MDWRVGPKHRRKTGKAPSVRYPRENRIDGSNSNGPIAIAVVAIASYSCSVPPRESDRRFHQRCPTVYYCFQRPDYLLPRPHLGDIKPWPRTRASCQHSTAQHSTMVTAVKFWSGLLHGSHS